MDSSSMNQLDNQSINQSIDSMVFGDILYFGDILWQLAATKCPPKRKMSQPGTFCVWGHCGSTHIFYSIMLRLMTYQVASAKNTLHYDIATLYYTMPVMAITYTT